jgi:hypothetical protein
MTCPACRHVECRRSRRRTTKDHLLSIIGLLPWRCSGCELRFYALAVPVSLYFHAHCSLCGNFELQKISAEHVRGHASFIGRMLHLPALRCDRCRHKFFSVRPLRRLPAGMVSHSAN